MPTPSLRILIVESEYLQRLSIERMLNQCGYHRVAPVSSFEELLTIIGHAVDPFDLLVINSALTVDSGISLEDFCRYCPNIRHALIYEGIPAPAPLSEEISGSVIRKLPRTPDTETIKGLMRQIDPDGTKRPQRLIFSRIR
ncbi:response regulator [Pseudomonas aeruginosa]|uniref:response regulator n=1 Tax=Pseudomonas aeruginosa TaxID=287 RepID=UPI001BC95819|nr:response regulator [Pseudomonas aeruginosa]MCO2439078.1 response regulator [Pseudomonas aeruginosa]MDD1820371.1 response regulator [Pseudomonas aeruginosa]MDN3852922.1 response regulator [Pseudomonas aeruginosa]MDY1462732.1 response regulator [Pseudomonas aeruginosa]HBP0288016.1 response regulator [Pseudomonas aeruginosa]